ncbi:hypothetical protein HMPREF2756_04590 [Rothia sp. HMSC067H10]|nr:hypothetical protein HMPREF2756_04590 [Rothia sp. HMSC067H10]
MSAGRRLGTGLPRHLAPAGALPLIHTNNCSKPASMRVSGSFACDQGLSPDAVRLGREMLAGPIGFLIARRAADGGTTTG